MAPVSRRSFLAGLIAAPVIAAIAPERRAWWIFARTEESYRRAVRESEAHSARVWLERGVVGHYRQMGQRIPMSGWVAIR
jgi:Leu/Phe-tRNA-protein transferase